MAEGKPGEESAAQVARAAVCASHAAAPALRGGASGIKGTDLSGGNRVVGMARAEVLLS